MGGFYSLPVRISAGGVSVDTTLRNKFRISAGRGRLSDDLTACLSGKVGLNRLLILEQTAGRPVPRPGGGGRTLEPAADGRVVAPRPVLLPTADGGEVADCLVVYPAAHGRIVAVRRAIVTAADGGAEADCLVVSP